MGRLEQLPPSLYETHPWHPSSPTPPATLYTITIHSNNSTLYTKRTRKSAKRKCKLELLRDADGVINVTLSPLSRKPPLPPGLPPPPPYFYQSKRWRSPQELPNYFGIAVLTATAYSNSIADPAPNNTCCNSAISSAASDISIAAAEATNSTNVSIRMKMFVLYICTILKDINPFSKFVNFFYVFFNNVNLPLCWSIPRKSKLKKHYERDSPTRYFASGFYEWVSFEPLTRCLKAFRIWLRIWGNICDF
jgi:hypothetical protein